MSSRHLSSRRSRSQRHYSDEEEDVEEDRRHRKSSSSLNRRSSSIPRKAKLRSESPSTRRLDSNSISRRTSRQSRNDDVHSSSKSSASTSSSSSSKSSRTSDDDDDSESSASSSSSSSRKSISSESDVDTASKSSGSHNSTSRFSIFGGAGPGADLVTGGGRGGRGGKGFGGASISGGASVISRATGRPISRQSQKDASSTSRLALAASLAVQRRKKESPQLLASLENRKVREVDYHKNPTLLYTHLEKQCWREAAERCRTNPIETKTWVYRMDKRKSIMLWRMLPIHTAILYRAPVYVLLDLIQAFPNGPAEPDDRRMLPIHMACRIVCKEDVLRLLLKQSPSSVNAEDIKGRTPRDFLAESKRDNQSKVLQKVNARNRKNLLKILKEFEQMEVERLQSKRPGSISRSRSSRSQSRRSSRYEEEEEEYFDDDYDDHFDDNRSRASRGTRGGGGSVRNERPSSRASLRSNKFSRGGGASVRGGGNASQAPFRPPIHMNPSSRSMRNSRNDYDDDNMSRNSRRSKSGHSRVSRSSRNLGSAAPRLPPGRNSIGGFDDDEQDRLEISSIRFNSRGGGSVMTNSRPMSATSAVSDPEKDVEEEVFVGDGEFDNVNGVFTELWIELEERYPQPDEVVDEAILAENTRKAEARELAKEEALDRLKYYDPPKELMKLLVVINASDPNAAYDMRRPNTSSSNRAPLMPGRDNNGSRRVNACGALKALSKNEKNRLRLGRTKGVVSSLCNALCDPSATVEERYRCTDTLKFLSVPKKNWEAIFHADENLIPTLTQVLQDEDIRVRYNACFCLFLLSKAEFNRYEIYSDSMLMDALVEVSDVSSDENNQSDDMSVFSIDGDLAQKYQNLGSPSGIRQQGSPTTDSESKRGGRLCAIKTFLSISKVQEGARTMVLNQDLMSLLMRISGTMTAEENLLCMAIIVNLSRDSECMSELIHYPELAFIVEKGLGSKSDEVQKCASLALQNLSCNKQFRVQVGTGKNIDNVLSLLSRLAIDDNRSESQVSAIHVIKNLSLEPSNLIPLASAPGIVASLMNFTVLGNDDGDDDADEKENDMIDANTQYVAADALTSMSRWLNAIAVDCADKNHVDLRGRSLASLKVNTWNQYE